MCRTTIIIRKISPDRENRTPTRSGGVLLHPELPAMFYTLSRLLHGYLPKRKNNFTWCLFTIYSLAAFVVFISREIDVDVA